MFRIRIFPTDYWTSTAIVIVTMLFSLCAAAQVRRAIEAQDCVTVRYLAVDNTGQRAIRMNQQATRAIYLVKSPRIETNENVIELYVVNLTEGAPATPRLLLSGLELSQLQWLQDGIHVAFLYRKGNRKSIYQVNTETGAVLPLISLHGDIVEYSADNKAATIAFATEEPDATSTGDRDLTTDDIESGYRIPFTSPEHNELHHRRIYVARKRAGGAYQIAPITIVSPFDHARLASVPYLGTLHMSLSPDGLKLLTNYVDTTEQLPPAWLGNKYVQQLRNVGFSGVLPTLLINLKDRETTLAINSPWIANTPLWAPDSRTFAVYAESPIGTEWERSDEREKQTGSAGAHLFFVDAAQGTVQQIVPRMTDISKQPLAWTQDGTMVLRISATTISTFKQSPVRWKQAASIELPLKDYFRFSELASDGTNVIGDYENSYTPPEIFSYRSKEREVSVISRLNSQFDHLILATAKPIRWTTSNGYSVEGFLFVPPGYKQEKRYPLVIQTKAYEGQFACDTGYNHYPSFAPQPIASADMMYLVRTYPEKWRENDEVQHYPSGYPGGVSEAAFQMDVWDSAVRELASQGLVDINRVGIIGFSRTGWYTEFILTHSSIPYRAATLTDNVQYNLPEYWNLRTPSTLRGWDAMYGGPPFGQTLQNWIDYSASFHLEKVHAAVLMEEMGYGIQFDDPKKPPLYLSTAMDWFTGLTSLSRPIEMYYYPNEDHQPDHPKARLATLQRNVDWYRFWLEGQERNAPSTDTQYRRWERLRREQHSDSPEPF